MVASINGLLVAFWEPSEKTTNRPGSEVGSIVRCEVLSKAVSAQEAGCLLCVVQAGSFNCP